MSPAHYRQLGLGLIGGGLGVAIGLMDWEHGLEGSPWSLLILMASWFAGGVALFRGRQHQARARMMSAKGPLDDGRPDVLYLRAFSSDPSAFGALRTTGLSTEEEDLAAAVRPLGDLVTVGRPGETLPTPGGARM